MELREYLEAINEDPWTFPAVEGCPDPPPEWIAAAWDTDTVQETIASDLAREVSKSGSLCCAPEFLETLAEALSAEQVLQLFEMIRNESPHRESEFRPEFEAGFAEYVDLLPPPLTRGEVIELLGAEEMVALELLGETYREEGAGD